MPFVRSTPAEMRARLRAEVESVLSGSDARLRRSIEEILVRVTALGAEEHHQHLDWNAKQLLPDTAEDEVLARHASIWGVARLARTFAHGDTCTVSGATQGAIIPAGAELRRGDDVRFVTDVDATVGAGGGATLAVTALVAGSAANTEVGTTLDFVSPIPGVVGAVTVAGDGIRGGEEEESDDRLLSRLLDRIQDPPAGGKASDYKRWARQIAGVGEVFVYPGQYGRGTVAVLFLTEEGGIPPAPLVVDVAATIEAERPVTAAVTVLPPAAFPIAYTVKLDPDTSAARAAAEAAMVEFHAAEVAPGEVLHLSRLSAAISAADGENWHRIISPVADPVPGWGQLPTYVPGSVTWA
ncbi:baseplate J/gp47 family protein [Pararoseomonas sp. SCSIO 73927]|uniref:baseplate J/gp47 family protein n=1 Tax=Pararoseomonas sp. SCSIO 73927 TaxID=3114537 RepID=UPI0030D02BAB